MDNIFELLMFLVVIGTSVFRFIKGRKVKKAREQLVALAPILNATIDPGRRSISGNIDEVPFKVKYEPPVENQPERIEVTLTKPLPFTLNVTQRQGAYDREEANNAGEFLLEDKKFDERFTVTTDDVDACREYLIDPLFTQGVEFMISQGYSIRFTRRRAVFSTPDSEWLSDTENAADSLKKTLQLGYSMIAEF
ncbi:hypothetical protein N9F76_00985 [bacterium]|jgi:hypothetical protein|nr:hypothetical protein [bacterium]